MQPPGRRPTARAARSAADRLLPTALSARRSGAAELGFWLGRITFVKENVEMILIGIVMLSFLPIVIEVVKARRQNRRTVDTGR